MPEANRNNNRHSRAKPALAAGLTIAFLVVVVVQVRSYSGDGDVQATVKAPTQESTVNNDASRARPRANSDDANALARVVPWPEVELADCTGHDPFATPSGFLPKQEAPAQKVDAPEDRQREIELAQKRAAQQRAISELMEAGVNAIFKGPDDHSTAVVGTYTLEVGDEIHGHRVVAIEPQGIILEPLAPVP